MVDGATAESIVLVVMMIMDVLRCGNGVVFDDHFLGERKYSRSICLGKFKKKRKKDKVREEDENKN
jgi:hypothetical protein